MKKLLLHIMLLIFSFAGFAQDAKFEAKVNKHEVKVGESFRLSYTLNSSGNNFRAPTLTDNFKVYSGPNQKSSMSFVNGKMSASLSFSYILFPIKTGEFIIEPARINVDGETVSSNAIKIKVVEKKSNTKQPSSSKQKQNNRSSGGNGQSQKLSSSDKLFLRLELSDNNVYNGESLVASYKLYNQLNIGGITGQKLPDFTGFYTDEVDIGQNFNASRQIIDGKVFEVYTLKKYVLFPQRSGKLTLKPFEIEAKVRTRSDEPVQTFFGRRYKMVEKNVPLKSNSATVNVKALPNPPPSFNGAVGDFTFTPKLDNNIVNANEAINLTLEVSGMGNINLIELIDPEFPADFEVYDPKINLSSKNTGANLRGSKTWEYLIIPRHEGEFEITVPSFTFFNPATGKYESTEEKLYQIKVNRGVGGNAQVGQSATTKRNVEQLAKDIRYIKTSDTELRTKENMLGLNIGIILGLFALPVILSAVIIAIFRRQENLKKDVVGYKKRKASRMAQRHLKRATQLIEESDKNAFYEELYRALHDYLSNKLNIATSELDFERINKTLGEQGIEESSRGKLKSVLESCQMARFAPSQTEEPQKLLSDATDVIEELEKELK
ncbi:BatD family protein [Salibacter sp.]|uniref:BatD family protein n=1 Tax=Salibacter sp. TaxID=2010995 RepID=UPI0028702EA7|nr:BatD family protein [Salibacter sp.]MDR9487435.1 BatD family protein [Salibacter sp.]